MCILQTRPIFELCKPYKSHFEGIQTWKLIFLADKFGLLTLLYVFEYFFF